MFDASDQTLYGQKSNETSVGQLYKGVRRVEKHRKTADDIINFFIEMTSFVVI